MRRTTYINPLELDKKVKKRSRLNSFTTSSTSRPKSGFAEERSGTMTRSTKIVIPSASRLPPTYRFMPVLRFEKTCFISRTYGECVVISDLKKTVTGENMSENNE